MTRESLDGCTGLLVPYPNMPVYNKVSFCAAGVKILTGVTFTSTDYEALIRTTKVGPNQAFAPRVAEVLVNKFPGDEVDVLGLSIVFVDQNMRRILADAHGSWRRVELHLILQLSGGSIVDVYFPVLIDGHQPPAIGRSTEILRPVFPVPVVDNVTLDVERPETSLFI